MIKKNYTGLRVISTTVALVMVFIFGCQKKEDPTPITNPPSDTTIVPAVDPAIAKTMGFFLDQWSEKTFAVPDFADEVIPTSTVSTVTVDASQVITKIPSTIYGQNANTWMTPLVTEPVFMNHITNLEPHIIRFPCGSCSDVYFWNVKKQDELPSDVPATLVDKDGVTSTPNYWYGMTSENWTASLDNYYAMLQQSNNTGILTMNYGYARYGTSANPVATAAHLAADWVRYDNGRTKFWEIGNEVYGDWESGYRIDKNQNKDGQPQLITGQLYAQHFKVFADSMRKAADEIGAQIYIGAVMYESQPQSWQAQSFQTWNTLMLPELNNYTDYYIGHNYFTPYNENSTASVILNAALTQPAAMINFMTQTLTSKGVEIKPIAMTEWNMWAKDSKQQVSNVSGAFAVLVLGEALKNKYGLAARWDLLNGWSNGDDHGLFSAGDEPGVSKWSPRPSFYYLYFLQKMTGDRLVSSILTTGNPSIKSYASTYSSGQANVTLVNTGATDQTVEVKFKNFRIGNRYYWYELKGSNDNGEFSRKVLVNGSGPTGVAGGPANYATLKAKSSLTANGIKVTVPALGAVCLAVDKK